MGGLGHRMVAFLFLHISHAQFVKEAYVAERSVQITVLYILIGNVNM